MGYEMIMQLGLGMLLLALMNNGYIVREVYKHTPNWRDEDVTSDDLVKNFMTNTPPDRLQLIGMISKANPTLLIGGALCIVLAMVI
jgi:hypothetical protein